MFSTNSVMIETSKLINRDGVFPGLIVFVIRILERRVKRLNQKTQKKISQ